MTDGARTSVLGGIRAALGRGELPPEARDKLDAALAASSPNLVPARAQLPHAEQVDLFVSLLENVQGTCARVASESDVPASLARYLAEQNLPARVMMAPGGRLDTISWDDQPTLEVSRGKTAGDDTVGVTGAFAALAETGTVVVASGPESPSTLNMLPETHVVVLWASQVVASMEDAWRMLREQAGGNAAAMPRTTLFVTGPSRTGDIEQTMFLGAHGPRRFHVVLIDDEGAAPARG